jgi:hypothetical protein
MARRSGHTPRGLLAMLAAWAVGFPALLHYFGHREAHFTAPVHFWLVATTASVAAASSIGLTVAGARARDGRTVLLGAAFSTMTALLAIHGIATPGIVVGANGIVALFGGASLPVGGAVLALSALPAMRRPFCIKWVIALQIALAVVVIGLGTLGLLVPSAVPSVPRAGSAPAILLLVAGALFRCSPTARCARTRSRAVPPTCSRAWAASGSAGRSCRRW